MSRLFQFLLALTVVAACATIARAEFVPPSPLVVVSDDNFSARQVTQFAAFDYLETT